MKITVVFAIAVAMCAGCVSQGIRRPQTTTPATPAYVEPQISDKYAATLSGTLSVEGTNTMGVGIGKIDGIRVGDKLFNFPLKIVFLSRKLLHKLCPFFFVREKTFL